MRLACATTVCSWHAKHTSNETSVPTEQHATKRSHSREQVGSAVRLNVRPDLRHVELGHDCAAKETKQVSQQERERDEMLCDQTLSSEGEMLSVETEEKKKKARGEASGYIS